MIEILILIFLIFIYIHPFKGILNLTVQEESLLKSLLENKLVEDKTKEVLTNTDDNKVNVNDLIDIDTLTFLGEDKGDMADINLTDIAKLGK